MGNLRQAQRLQECSSPLQPRAHDYFGSLAPQEGQQAPICFMMPPRTTHHATERSEKDCSYWTTTPTWAKLWVVSEMVIVHLPAPTAVTIKTPGDDSVTVAIDRDEVAPVQVPR
jgi:hypothetical protein